MSILRLLAVGSAATVVLAIGTSSASAGEVTGNGKPTQGPAHANSICVYSGLNDDTAEEPGRVQNYGQIVKAGFKDFAPSPGEACNGHTGFLAGGGGE